MTTYKDIVDETINTLHGVSQDLEQLTSLTQNIGTGDLSFTVDDASQISRGLIEVGEELMWVKSADRTANAVNISAFGRGFRQTVAATHSTSDMVVNSPLFPRALVRAAIQEILQAVYPEIFAVTSDETQTVNPSVVTYQVPAAALWISDIAYQTPGPSQMWIPVRRWKFDPTADTTAFPTGKSVDIFDAMAPGRTIKITYAKQPGALTVDTDTLVAAGLREGMRDVLVFGASSRMLVNLEASRLQTNAVAQSERDQLVTPGAATNASRYFLQLYLTRLADEVKALQSLYPTTSHLTR